MIWIIAGVVIVAALFFAVRPKSSPPTQTVRQSNRDAQSRAAQLPTEEQAHLASDIRSTAFDHYDRIAEAARATGKDEVFAHQAGVLQALTAVASPGREPSAYDQRELQMETVPFNKSPPIEGRLAVAEYCVWKFFPAQADDELFAPSLLRFRDELLADGAAPEDVVVGMLYSMKYDWQLWLTDHRDADDPTPFR